MSKSEILDHLEAHFGPFAEGWKDPNWGDIQVLRFNRGPISGAGVLATVGLSLAPLVGPSGRRISIELVMLFRHSEGPRAFPAIVGDLCAEALRGRRPILCGQLVGPRGPLFPGATTEAFFAAIPVHFPPSFQVTPRSRVAFAWLVPVTGDEAEFIRSHGPDQFLGALDDHTPDLLDLSRSSIVKC